MVAELGPSKSSATARAGSRIPRKAAALAPAMHLRARVHAVLDQLDPDDRLGRWLALGLLGLIVLNVVAAVLGTETALYEGAPGLFDAIEGVSLAIFTLEYVLRLWACTASPAYAHPVLGRLRYALQPLVLIDLLAILPFLIGAANVDTRFLRVLRLLRILRALRILHHSEAMRALKSAVARRWGELATVIGGLVVVLLLVSSLVYIAEHDQPGTPFRSIPVTMWWGIVTLTTVGYGDIVPVTAWGRFLAGCTALLGIGMLALPTSILGASFLDELQERRKAKAAPVDRCPTCGK